MERRARLLFLNEAFNAICRKLAMDVMNLSGKSRWQWMRCRTHFCNDARVWRKQPVSVSGRLEEINEAGRDKSAGRDK